MSGRWFVSHPLSVSGVRTVARPQHGGMGWRWHDTAVAAGVFTLDAVTVLVTVDGDDRPLMPLGWTLLIVSSAVLLWRQRFPVAVLVLAAATTLAYYPMGFPDAPIVLNLAIALYTAARLRTPVLSVSAAGVLSLMLCVPADEPLEVAIGVVPILLLPVVLGEMSRARTRQISVAEDRAALAEATRECEALRRAEEERLRIARELHDVLAHQISLISVQAGAALHTRESESAFEAGHHHK